MATTRTEADACTFLDNDHKAVKKMFKAYEELAQSKARGVADKKLELAQEICQELKVHATIEEEIFYPALRTAIKETDLLAEAEVEHAGAKDLIAQIESATQADEMFDAKVKVLGEYIDHHVKEEEKPGEGYFYQARETDVDLVALRDAMLAGDVPRLVRMMGGLKAEGEALPLVLWAIGEEIRTLARVSQAQTAGQDLTSVLRSQRVFGSHESLARQALSRVAARNWPAAVQHAHEVDRLIKGLQVAGRLQDPWEEMTRLAMRVAAGARA